MPHPITRTEPICLWDVVGYIGGANIPLGVAAASCELMAANAAPYVN